MAFFHVIEEAQVVLRHRGVYRQSKVYRRGDGVYAGWGAGFVRLTGGAGTTVPNVSWSDLEAAGVVQGHAGKAPRFEGAGE